MNIHVINHLHQLESAGLVQLAQVTPDLEYLFRHNLVQEAAYASLLSEDQQRLHLEVGEILEEFYADRVDEIAAPLALHFERAGETQQALHYTMLACRVALDGFANQEAESHARHALALISRAAAEQASLKIDVQAAILGDLGEALYRQSRYSEAIQSWKQAIQAYQSISDSENVARLYARSARAAWFTGDIPAGLKICLEGMQAVASAPEGPGVAQLIHETARAYYFNGMPEKTLPLCQKALAIVEAIAETSPDHSIIEVQADTLTTMGILHDISPQEALAALEKAVALADQFGLLQIAHRAYINLGSTRLGLLGDLESARQCYLKAAEIARQRGAVQEELFSMIGWLGLAVEGGDFLAAENAIPSLEKLQKELAKPGISHNEIQLTKLTIQGMRFGWKDMIGILRDQTRSARQSGDLQSFSLGLITLVEALLEIQNSGSLEDPEELENLLIERIQLVDKGMEKSHRALPAMSIFKARQKLLGQAHEWLQKARQATPGQQDIWQEMNLKHAEAVLAVAEERWLDADQAYQFITTSPMAHVGRWGQARLRMDWARTYLQRGEAEDLEKAQELLLQSEAQFQQMGATYYVDLAQELLQISRNQTLAQAIAQKTVARELAQAGRVQGSFLPEEIPTIPGWQIAARLQPARQTSGDFYDFIPFSDGRLGLVIADVTDKGMGAALYMTSTRTLLRAFAAEYPESPSQTITTINQRLMADTHGGLFITLFYAILDPADGSLRYCNAGHNPPYLFPAKPEQGEKPLENTGIPVGIFEEASWHQELAVIEPGGFLVLFTDGVTEAQNPEGELFNEKRLLDTIRDELKKGTLQASELQRSILTALDVFRDQALQSDDITLMVIIRD